MIAHLTNIQKGILFAILGYTSFAFADTNAKWMVDVFPPLQIMCIQAGISMIILLGLKNFMGGIKGWNDKRELRIHIMRGVVNFFVSIIVISSFQFLSLAEVYAMIFAKPFIAVPLAMFIYGEVVNKKRWLSIVAGFIGVLMVLQPGVDMDFYMLLPLFGAALVAVMFLSSRSLTEASPFVLAFYPMAITFALSFPFMMMNFVEPSLMLMGHLLLGGILVTSGLTFLSLAFRVMDASLVTPFLYTEMIWGLLFGYLLFGDIPNFWMLAGTAIIIASGLYIVLRQDKIDNSVNNLDA